MKIFDLKIIILILTLKLILNQETEIHNYEKVIINPEGVYNYSYKFENSSSFSETPYFYFKFSDENRRIKCEIIDEDGNVNNLKIKEGDWISYKLSLLKKQSFTFRILNDNHYSINMMFLDSASEIKIYLDQFINFEFQISKVEEKPKPLEIIIEQIEEEEFYYFVADNFLNYCLLGENNECDYALLKELNLEKNKKYKIEYNCKEGNYFSFESFYTIKELQLEKIVYTINLSLTERYFLINIKNKADINVYIDKQNYYIGYISEDDKNKLPDNINDIYFDSSSPYISKITNDNDYVILKVGKSMSIIYFFEGDKIDIDIDSNSEISFEINKEGNLLLNINCHSSDETGILVSSDKNIDILSSSFNFKTLKNILVLSSGNHYIYLNSTKEKSLFKYYTFWGRVDDIYTLDLIYDYNFDNYLKQYNQDSFFTRKTIFDYFKSFYNKLVTGLDEEYFLYIKKYFGFTDIYKYNKYIDESTYFPQFYPYLKSYENSNNYKLINNELLTISGNHVFSFEINYNSLFDLYIQKVDDLEYIQINSEIFQYNNLVKLLNANKTYYINFTIDHIIKLDNNFSEAEIIFKNNNGDIFYLNKSKRILDNLKGDNITVISSINALIYFYKKIPNYSEKNAIIFDKSQKRKNMKFEIENNNNENVNIRIVKDFGIPGCYPMKSPQYWEIINSNSSKTTIYIENYYDKVNYTNDEEDSYIIYLFESYDENNIPIFISEDYTINNPIYFENLLTPGNKYNFQVIQPNANGALILEFLHRENEYQNPLYKDIQYRFMTCKSKEIKFKIENSKGYFDYDLSYDNLNYPYEITITENKSIIFYLYSTYQTLVHSFESEDEFLFYYTDYRQYGSMAKKDEFQIISIEGIKSDIIRIIFYGIYSSINKYYIIITKKDEDNNINSFSDLCYVAKLMINNSDSIVVKTTYNKGLELTTADVNINKLNPNENDKYIVSIIEESIRSAELIYYTGPKEFKFEKLKKAIDIKFGEEINFDFEKRNYFKFEYNKESDNQVLYFFSDSNEEFNIILFENDNYNIIRYNNGRDTQFKLFSSGIYYIELIGNYKYANINNNTFTILVSGGILDKIDFTKKFYKKDFNFILYSMPPSMIIKVNNLTENRNVYFDYYSNYNGENIFEICNDITEECTKEDIFIYKFLKDNNYTIKINAIKAYVHYSNIYSFPSYLFLPILKENVEEKENGYYILKEPKIYIINLEINNYLFSKLKNEHNAYISLENDNISLDDYDSLSFEYMDLERYFYREDGYKYAIVILIPNFNMEKPTFFTITNKLLALKKPGEYLIQKGENAIIYYKMNYLSNNVIYNNEEKGGSEDNSLSLYNTLVTFTSPIKNMKILFSSFESEEQSDFIAHNTFNDYGYPIYIEKTNSNITILIKEYEPKYAFFGAANYELFNSYFTEKKLKGDLNYFFHNNTLHFRVSSNDNSFYEFFNFYFYDMKENINIYIKKYFGNSELYEYNPNLLDKNDFSILNKGILYNINKTSVLNKMINLKGENKLFMGYLDYNSVFDIYLELENNLTEIEENNYIINDYGKAVKFLKKDIEYSLTFENDYLIKLEEGFDAEVYIYNNNTNAISVLNSTKRTCQIYVENIKIKSNNDALVYFYKKYDNLQAYKIDPKEVGKNLEIKVSQYTYYFIDIGFEKYYPFMVLDIYSQSLGKGENLFIENVYDKLKVNLTEEEYYYFYYYSEKEIETKYTKNINNKNNEYSFIYIPKNSSDQTLIINNINKDKILYQINYCNLPHSVKLYFQESKMTNETLLEFNDTTIIEKTISKLPHKLRFDSENDFLFSYSFIDDTDSAINDYKKWNEERVELTNLTIEEITKNDNSSIINVVAVKFKPNYINSTARYVLIISENNEKNTFDNFNNPCYITKLVNEKAKGYKIVNIFDNGENDSINVEVDINEILGNNDKYIINIISQELRFEKKINYYTPIIFTYKKEEEKNESDKEEDDDDDFPLVYVIIFSSVGLILLITIFLIIRCIKKRKNDDLNKDTQNIPKEKLLSDL